jgi:hypothetical protein
LNNVLVECTAFSYLFLNVRPVGSPAILAPSWRRWEGVAEEARTVGFPSSPFGGFGFVSKKRRPFYLDYKSGYRGHRMTESRTLWPVAYFSLGLKSE